MRFLGIDTSCYTTSAAVYDSSKGLMGEERIVLSVKEGRRGLSQSEMVFQHVKNLPVLLRRLSPMLQDLNAAGAVCSLGPVLLPAAQRLGPVVEICAVCSPDGGLCADHTALRTAAYEQPEKVSAFCVHCRPAASCGSRLPAGGGDMEPVGKPYLSAHLFYQDR